MLGHELGFLGLQFLYKRVVQNLGDGAAGLDLLIAGFGLHAPGLGRHQFLVQLLQFLGGDAFFIFHRNDIVLALVFIQAGF